MSKSGSWINNHLFTYTPYGPLNLLFRHARWWQFGTTGQLYTVNQSMETDDRKKVNKM